MAKEKAVPVTEDLTGFMRVNDTTGRDVLGLQCNGSGVLLRVTTDVTDAEGQLVGRTVAYEYLRDARIDPVCVDGSVPFGNLVGGK